MLHTTEQFANKQIKESHKSVAQGATKTDRQTDENVKHPAAAPTMTSTYVKPADSQTRPRRKIG